MLTYTLKKMCIYLYAENYKMPIKEMKEDLTKWRDIPYS